MMIKTQTEIKAKLSPPDTITAMEETENLWENPSEATEAMKKAIKTVKHKINFEQKWDGVANYV